MIQNIARVIGCNAPATFAIHGNRLFVPTDNGVVIAESGDEHLWFPFPSGKYTLDKVVVSSAGVLCLTEKRLHVALNFFDASSLQSLGVLETDISVGVTDMVFSTHATELFVASTVPETSVRIFRQSTRNGTYSFVHRISLQYSEVPRHLIAGGADSMICVTICTDDYIVGYTHTGDNDSYQKCFSLDAHVESLCAAGLDRVCYTTIEGSVHLYSHESQSRREICEAPLAKDAASMLVREDTAFIFTRSGNLLSIDLTNGSHDSRFLGRLPSCPSRIVDMGTGELLLSTQTGLLAVVVPFTDSSGAVDSRLVRGCREASTLKCLSVKGGTTVVWVSRDGSVALYEKGSITVFPSCCGDRAAVHACVLNSSQIAILFEDATVCCFDCAHGKQAWVHRFQDCTLTFLEADGLGTLACFGKGAFRFLKYVGDNVEDIGIVRAPLLASISLGRWIPGEVSLLVMCTNGDTFLMEAPSCGDADTEHAPETLVRNSWRLDFPVTDLLVCYVSPDALNLFVHSADHDSKVYMLDRLYEGDIKVSRPLFLIHDHNSGGSCLLRLNDTTVVSCGRDGSITARDLTPYQVKMTPIPPSREKRKSLWMHTVRSAFRGGITTVATSDDGDLLVCGGDDGVIQCVALKAQGARVTWRVPQWTCVEAQGARTGGDEVYAAQASDVGPEREALLREIAHARELWTKAMSDNDTEVPLEAFLTSTQRDQFVAECESAIFNMREGHYYRSILNEYLQETIRKRCCEAMEVERVKVVSMNTTELEVHNFHIHSRTRAEESLSRKALFLRHLQQKVSTGRSTPPGLQLVSKTATLEAGLPRGVEDYDAFMLSDADAYTQSRMVLQSLLVRGRLLALKDAFNDRFAYLQDLKRQSVAEVEERTLRCVSIGKELGGFPKPLFTPIVSPEENPNSIFEVEDRELSAEAQALIAPTKGAAVVSVVDEAALHLWMDGLEKEVVRLEVHVPLPDFIDDTRDSFVPPEERTEEQVRIIEAYTKRLKEETDAVEAKRDALRSEFKSLQEKNRETAAKLDEQLRQIREFRLSMVEEIDEAELQLAVLFQHRLCVSAAYGQYRTFALKRGALCDRLAAAESAVAQQKRLLTAAQAQLATTQRKTSGYAESVAGSSPFDDSAAGEKLYRRFLRWQRRFEGGKAPLPDPDTPAADCTADLWATFCGHCQTLAELQHLVDDAGAEVQRYLRDVEEAQEDRDFIAREVDAAEKEMDAVRSNSVPRLLDVYALWRLYQGQVQDEGANTATSFSTSNLRWRDDVAQYNELILQSDAESRLFLNKVFARRKLIKLLEWERERLKYSAGTLQLELRQLHTLCVTRQMQEWLSGGEDLSEEKILAKVQKHIDVVETNMRRKVEELRNLGRRLKGQIAERGTENTIVGAQRDSLNQTVHANSAVFRLTEARADGAGSSSVRAREMFLTSELEELARSQQEELVRLKLEVDRLRERTFPSFTVVSKQTR